MGGMILEYDEEQAMLRDAVARFARDRYDATRRLQYLREPHGFHSACWDELAQNGFFMLPFSRESGGLGGGPTDILALMEAVGQAHLVEPVLTLVLMGGLALEHYGSEEQIARLMPGVIAGKSPVAVAHSEGQSIQLSGHVATTVRQCGRNWVLNGLKRFCFAGDVAKAFIISARDEAGDFGLYLADGEAPGIQRQQYRLLDGSQSVDLKLHDVVGEPMRETHSVDDRYSTLVCLSVAAETLGLLSGMFEQTLEYLKTRVQFGRPIGKFQSLQHRMAKHFAMLEMMRADLYFGVGALESVGEAGELVHNAQSLVAHKGLPMAEDFLQMHGGVGMTEDLAVSQAFRRVVLLTSLFRLAAWEDRSGASQAAAARSGVRTGVGHWA